MSAIAGFPTQHAATESEMESSRCEGELTLALHNYRYYRFDSSDGIRVAESICAASDEDAISQINRKHPDGKCEIWQGSRLVAKLSSHRFDPDAPRVQDAVAARLLARVLRIRTGLES